MSKENNETLNEALSLIYEFEATFHSGLTEDQKKRINALFDRVNGHLAK